MLRGSDRLNIVNIRSSLWRNSPVQYSGEKSMIRNSDRNMDWVKQELVILVKRSELSGSAASLLVNTSSDQRILSDTRVWSVPGSWSLTEGDISSVVVNNNTEKYAAPVSRNLLSQEHNCSCDKYRGAWTRFLQNKLIFLGDTRCQHLVEEKQHPAQISVNSGLSQSAWSKVREELLLVSQKTLLYYHNLQLLMRCVKSLILNIWVQKVE